MLLKSYAWYSALLGSTKRSYFVASIKHSFIPHLVKTTYESNKRCRGEIKNFFYFQDSQKQTCTQVDVTFTGTNISSGWRGMQRAGLWLHDLQHHHSTQLRLLTQPVKSGVNWKNRTKTSGPCSEIETAWHNFPSLCVRYPENWNLNMWVNRRKEKLDEFFPGQEHFHSSDQTMKCQFHVSTA